jgi:hypothetical protein
VGARVARGSMTLAQCQNVQGQPWRGPNQRQIGEERFITPKTASVHVSRILAKLGVAGRGEAAAIAHRLGLDE